MIKLIFFVFIFSIELIAQETLESIQRQIKAVQAETTRENKMHQDEKKRHADFIENGRKKVLALNNQKTSLTNDMDSIRVELKRIQEHRQKSLSRLHFYEKKKKKYRESLIQKIDSLQYIFQTDFPYKNTESIKEISDIAFQLKQAYINELDAITRSVEVFLNRIQLGYTTEVWKGELSVENRKLRGSFLRYGAITTIFVSLDAQEVYYLSKNSETGFSWTPVKEDLELRTKLKEALKVAEAKTAPKIVEIPIYLLKEAHHD